MSSGCLQDDSEHLESIKKEIRIYSEQSDSTQKALREHLKRNCWMINEDLEHSFIVKSY